MENSEHQRFVFEGKMYYFYFDFDQMQVPKLVTVRTLDAKLPNKEADQRAFKIADFLFGFSESAPSGLSWIDGWESEFEKA